MTLEKTFKELFHRERRLRDLVLSNAPSEAIKENEALVEETKKKLVEALLQLERGENKHG